MMKTVSLFDSLLMPDTLFLEISSLNLKLVFFILSWIFAAMELDGRSSQETGYTTLITPD